MHIQWPWSSHFKTQQTRSKYLNSPLFINMSSFSLHNILLQNMYVCVWWFSVCPKQWQKLQYKDTISNNLSLNIWPADDDDFYIILSIRFFFVTGSPGSTHWVTTTIWLTSCFGLCRQHCCLDKHTPSDRHVFIVGHHKGIQSQGDRECVTEPQQQASLCMPVFVSSTGKYLWLCA